MKSGDLLQLTVIIESEANCRSCHLILRDCIVSCKFCQNYGNALVRNNKDESLLASHKTFEPLHEKTNNLGSDQVGHKSACTVTEEG